MFVVISYDIPHDRRRAKLATLLLNYGKRVQWSVFEFDLTALQLARLQLLVEHVIIPAEDRVRIYRLPADAVREIRVLGHGRVTEDPDYLSDGSP